MPDDNIVSQILSVLSDTNRPVGSGRLCQLLEDKGIKLSEATAGRMLSEMDRLGMTQRINFEGRVITEKGYDKLEEYNNKQSQKQLGDQLLSFLEVNKMEDLLDLLEARRGIEGELARLAALRATDKELELLSSNMLEQEKMVSTNRSIAIHDSKFHKLIAQAAKNKVLSAALELIGQDEHSSPLFECIRKQAGSELVSDHREIVKGIMDKNPELAEEAMTKHIEGLMQDVYTCWDQVRT